MTSTGGRESCWCGEGRAPRPPAASYGRRRGDRLLPTTRTPGERTAGTVLEGQGTSWADRLRHGRLDGAAGHEQIATTNIYLRADMTHKQQAIDRTKPIGTKPGRYRPPDALLAFLESL